MAMKELLLASSLLLSTTAGCLAQSQTGSNFGTPYSGSAATRSNGGGSHVHSHHRDWSEQSARGSGGEIDARDSSGAASVARQASTPQK
jgi:hypothetical protein